MNVIFIMTDSFRRDHVGAYGNEWIHTPSLDGFAAESVVFDRAYTASFPTVPNRRDVLTGRYTFTYSAWEPIRAEDVTVPGLLAEAGVTSMMVCDTPHVLQKGYNYSRDFSAYEHIRGQENDRWRTAPAEVEFPCDPSKLRSPEGCVRRYLRNTSWWRDEADHFAPRTMARAVRWLEENRDADPFFLYVDTFDPHEPWDPPASDLALYEGDYDGESVIYPRYGPADFLSEAELRHIRALYAGECTMVDRWIGKVLTKVDELGLGERTVVIITADHGFYHGERGHVGKLTVEDDPRRVTGVRMHDELIAVPLMVRAPGAEPGRSSALAQAPDVAATVLEALDVEAPHPFDGQSLLGDCPRREAAVTSETVVRGPGRGFTAAVTDERWRLAILGEEAHGAEGPLTLYDLAKDPGETANVAGDNAEVVRRLADAYLARMEESGAEPQMVRTFRDYLS